MSVRIETPQGKRELIRFLELPERIHARRAAHWPAFVHFELAVLGASSPYLAGRTIHPLVALEDGEIVARAMAVYDERYVRHWNEPLGHVVMFEALPGHVAAVRSLFDAASAWLAERGATAARSGYGMLDLPFAIDDYESLPPTILRQNPPYYHALLKEAGFETEKGWVDYRIEVRPERIAAWQARAREMRRAGFEMVALRDRRRSARAAELAAIWNEAFAQHWGHTPTTADEFLFLTDALKSSGVLDASVLAYLDGEPVGALWLVPENGGAARLAPGRSLDDRERLNVLAICVHERARGHGLAEAMAAQGFLELIRRGARYLSYTLVLDDNWPSRRTAEKLGGEIRANYVTYRRELRR
jgi:GNAT superfamily N-acetyltransferase